MSNFIGGTPRACIAHRRSSLCAGLLVARFQQKAWRTALSLTGGIAIEGCFPEQPCVIIANHRSICDAPAMLASIPSVVRPVVVLDRTYWGRHPIRGLVSRTLMRGHYIRRGGGGYDDLLRVLPLLRAGRSVVIFPEGTRSRTGDVGRFRRGAFALARAADVPVLSVGLVGTAEVIPINALRTHRSEISVRVGTLMTAPEPSHARAVVAQLARPSTPDSTGRQSF
ncbi:lysophospholipid acyltransferase family protein [Streptomyces zaomyceticus]|uniref:lysophospholipid acyltransferase family protein n=1 Tax=Streptomyces zaomyceticus TaxID=68286 RepID=UPI0036B1A224